MSTWYPGLGSYTNWIANESFLSHFGNSRDKLAVAIRTSIQEQTEIVSARFKETIASQEQIARSVESGFMYLSRMVGEGFSEVVGAIDDINNNITRSSKEINSSILDLTRAVDRNYEATERVYTSIERLHSDLDYRLGTITFKIDSQTGILSNILQVLKAPLQTQVWELHDFGSDLLAQGRYADAEKYLLRAINMDTGEVFFPSHYLLGYLYLRGWDEKKNTFIDIKKAHEFLSKANELGSDVVKTKPDFKILLADCKYNLSLSYYYQLGESKTLDTELLKKAIQLAQEAVTYNGWLSQGHYHLAKYYALLGQKDKVLDSFKSAFIADKNYSLKFQEDGAFHNYRNEIEEMLVIKAVERGQDAKTELGKVLLAMVEIDKMNTKDSKLYGKEYQKIKTQVDEAERQFNTKTYFGFDECARISWNVSFELMTTNLAYNRRQEIRDEEDKEEEIKDKQKKEEQKRRDEEDKAYHRETDRLRDEIIRKRDIEEKQEQKLREQKVQEQQMRDKESSDRINTVGSKIFAGLVIGAVIGLLKYLISSPKVVDWLDAIFLPIQHIVIFGIAGAVIGFIIGLLIMTSSD